MSGISSGIESNIKKFDDYYSKPACWFRWRYDTQVKRKTCLELISALKTKWNGKRIFELGFGSGEVLFSFPKNCEIYGMEISSSAIKQAKYRAEKAKYKKFAFFCAQQPLQIPIDSNFIDLAVASHVMEHIYDDRPCLQELHRILKPQGALVIIVPINERFKDPNHLRQYTFNTCKSLCENYGFRFAHGFEHEYLFYLVEKMYWKYQCINWSFSANILRILFNIITAPLPFFAYNFFDSIFKRVSTLPPRQAALLFIKK